MGVMENSAVKMRRRTISIGMPTVVYLLAISSCHREQISCRRELTSIAKFSK